MHVIEIIPLIRGTKIDSLTYYSRTPHTLGDIIEIPIRKRVIRGLVISCSLAGKAKTALKAATFSLRKLPPQNKEAGLPDAIIQTARALTYLYPSKLGAILFAILPPEIINGDVITKVHEKYNNHIKIDTADITLFQDLRDARYIKYKSKIREAFAHGGSVLFVVPTTAEVDYAEENLQHGIEQRVVVFSSQRGKKKLNRAFESHNDLTKAKLIITTPTHAYIDRHDITTIIIDSCRSPYYKSRKCPYIDHREALRCYAEIKHAEVIMGDLLPRTEEEHQRREGVYLSDDTHPKRLAIKCKLKFIELKPTDKSNEQRFTIIAPSVINDIRKRVEKKEKVFLYTARRGIAPLVACYDCGHILKCPDSGAPYTLFRTIENGEENRWLLSSSTGKKIRAYDTCPNCGSWRLKEQGVGVQQIYDTSKKLFPNTPLILFDHTTATTHKRAVALVEEFYDTKGSILIGTNMVLPYMHTPVSATVLTSLEATRMTPTWRAEEELFALLLLLRDKTNDKVFVQSRSEIDPIFTHAEKGTVEQFYNEEMELREKLLYPPYVIFIHLTFTETSELGNKYQTELRENLDPHEITFYTSSVKAKSDNTYHGLVRIPASAWPNVKLMDRLRELPPYIRVEINPNSIL